SFPIVEPAMPKSLVRILSALLFTLTAAVVARADETPAPRVEPADGQPLAQRLYRDCSPSVVSIIAADREGERRGIGTGFVFGKEGYIATNLHVIGRSRSFRVQTKEGTRLPIESIHAFDGSLDLAILKVAQHDVPALNLGIAEGADVGQDIVVL